MSYALIFAVFMVVLCEIGIMGVCLQLGYNAGYKMRNTGDINA